MVLCNGSRGRGSARSTHAHDRVLGIVESSVGVEQGEGSVWRQTNQQYLVEADVACMGFVIKQQLVTLRACNKASRPCRVLQHCQH